MAECFEGWKKEHSNSKGRCCCNCNHQVEIHSHPWNQMSGGRMKGPISNIAGWGCSSPEVTQNYVIFMEQQHGACEAHEFKVEKPA